MVQDKFGNYLCTYFIGDTGSQHRKNTGKYTTTTTTMNTDYFKDKLNCRVNAVVNLVDLVAASQDDDSPARLRGVNQQHVDAIAESYSAGGYIPYNIRIVVYKHKDGHFTILDGYHTITALEKVREKYEHSNQQIPKAFMVQEYSTKENVQEDLTATELEALAMNDYMVYNKPKPIPDKDVWKRWLGNDQPGDQQSPTINIFTPSEIMAIKFPNTGVNGKFKTVKEYCLRKHKEEAPGDWAELFLKIKSGLKNLSRFKFSVHMVQQFLLRLDDDYKVGEGLKKTDDSSDTPVDRFISDQEQHDWLTDYLQISKPKRNLKEYIKYKCKQKNRKKNPKHAVFEFPTSQSEGSSSAGSRIQPKRTLKRNRTKSNAKNGDEGPAKKKKKQSLEEVAKDLRDKQHAARQLRLSGSDGDQEQPTPSLPNSAKGTPQKRQPGGDSDLYQTDPDLWETQPSSGDENEKLYSREEMELFKKRLVDKLVPDFQKRVKQLLDPRSSAQRILDLERRLKESTSRVEELDARLKEKEDVHVDTQAIYERHDAKVEYLQHELNRLNAINVDLDRAQMAAKEEAKDANYIVENVEAKLRDCRKENATLKEEIATLKKELTTRSSNVEKWKKQYEELEKKTDEERLKLLQHLQTVDAELDNCRKENANLREKSFGIIDEYTKGRPTKWSLAIKKRMKEQLPVGEFHLPPMPPVNRDEMGWKPVNQQTKADEDTDESQQSEEL